MIKRITTVEDLPKKMYGTFTFNRFLENCSKQELVHIHDAIVFYYNQFVVILNEHGKPTLLQAGYKFLDEKLKTVSSRPTKPITCYKEPKGCAFCCFINVDVTTPEAIVALGAAIENKLVLDWDRIRK